MTTNDLISRQEALTLVRDVCDAIMSCCGSHYDEEVEDEVYDDIREVDAILKCNKEIRIALKNLPSEQPEIKVLRLPYVKKTYDPFSALTKDEKQQNKWYAEGFSDAMKELSAQPQNIRCKDCKWLGEPSPFIKDKYDCKIVDRLVNVDSFCSWAERREE